MDEYNENRIKKYIQKNWNEYLNFINCVEERKNKKKEVFHKPFVMYLDPTSFCNLQCPFCTTGQRINGRDSASMSLEHFEKILNYFNSNLFHVTLYSWGEPLLNNNFEDMVKVLKKFNISSDVSTNLSFPISYERAKKLISCGLDKISFSIDGVTQEIYEKYRIGGNLEMILKNIEIMIKAKNETNSETKLLWRFLVFKHNQHEIDKAKKLAKKIGIDILFEPGFFDPNKKNEWAASNEFARDFWPYDNDDIEITQDSQLKLAKVKSATLLPNLDMPIGCDWLWYATTINSNLSISPCCITTLQSQDFGSFDEQQFSKDRNNSKFTNARKLTLGEEYEKSELICERCPAVEVWHQLDDVIIPIVKAMINKLPKEYENFKKIEPEEQTPPGELAHYFTFNGVDWKLIGWLKAIIINENENHLDELQNNESRLSLNQLYQIYTERLDLQTTFPEIEQGNIQNLIKWAKTFGIKEDQRLLKYEKYYV